MSPPVEELLKKLFNKRKAIFPHALRCFASTLHFHSPAAYLFVRKTFLKCLPHPSTFQKWMQNINTNPGISETAIKTVQNIINTARENKKNIVFNLTLDEMSIKKKVDWDGQKSHGFVDVGAHTAHTDNLPLASEVLVFMLVAINHNFKMPVAYYLTDHLSDREKGQLLTTILCKLFENNIDITSRTFDGAPSNISMCEELGARLRQTDIENIIPYFLHPANKLKRIYIFYDACHMIKLVRNTLSMSNLTDNDKETVSWTYIKQLVSLQEKEELHIATEVRNRHVNFKNEKMKVNLAAQVLSTSVSDALMFLEHDLKLPSFSAAAATAKFCRIFNDIFDILNSRNLYNKSEMKRALTQDTLPIIKNKTENFIIYIKSLKIQDIPVIKNIRKTGFIGLIIDLQNSIALADQLCHENIVHNFYLHTNYRKTT